MKKNPIVSFVEWCGQHPFATGLFALTSLVGLVLAIFWQDQNSRDTASIQESLSLAELRDAETATATESIQSGVDEVRSAVLADCSGPPCWSAAEALDGRLHRATRTMVDRKMPTPIRKDGYGWHYTLQECNFTVHFSDDVVTYYEISLLGAKCPEAWSLFNTQGGMPPQSAVTVQDLLGAEFSESYGPTIEVAAGCIDCGNAHEPFLEFVLPGTHAGNFYYRYFTTSFYGLQGVTGDEDYRSDFIASLQRRYPELDYLSIEQYCGKDLTEAVFESLALARVESIGFGFGTRTYDYKPDTCYSGP